jgi:hypothetical protein
MLLMNWWCTSSMGSQRLRNAKTCTESGSSPCFSLLAAVPAPLHLASATFLSLCRHNQLNLQRPIKSFSHELPLPQSVPACHALSHHRMQPMLQGAKGASAPERNAFSAQQLSPTTLPYPGASVTCCHFTFSFKSGIVRPGRSIKRPPAANVEPAASALSSPKCFSVMAIGACAIRA